MSLTKSCYRKGRCRDHQDQRRPHPSVPGTCNAVSNWRAPGLIPSRGDVIDRAGLNRELCLPASTSRLRRRGRPSWHQLTPPVSLPILATTCSSVNCSISLTRHHSDERWGRAGNGSADLAGHDDHSAQNCVADCGALDWETAKDIAGRRHFVHRHHEAVPSLSRYSVYRGGLLRYSAQCDTLLGTDYCGDPGPRRNRRRLRRFATLRKFLAIATQNQTLYDFPSFKTGAIAAQ